ncbi:MAG: DUF4249 domain-containing protein [Bacteroidales bacterium]|nr:DUF4249 domain-containing protein [Bacteroidales bacterium]
MKYSILFTIFLILFTSCQDDLEIPDTGRKIVINGLITTDSLLNVDISRSAYITNVREYVFRSDLDNAEVCFYQDDVRMDSLYHSILYVYSGGVFFTGNYCSKSVYPLPGKQYKIVVKAPGLPDATATTIIPDLVRIERVDTSRIILTTTSTNRSYRMTYNIEFTDPVNETNYYLFNVCRKPRSRSYSNNISFDCSDPIVEEELKDNNLIYGIAFSDKIINGKKYSLTITVDGNWLSSYSYKFPHTVDDYMKDNYIDNKKTYYFNLYSIPEEYFKYIQTMNLYFERQGNPLYEPVMVYSNVTGGYGIFAGAAVSTDSVVFTFPN